MFTVPYLHWNSTLCSFFRRLIQFTHSIRITGISYIHVFVHAIYNPVQILRNFTWILYILLSLNVSRTSANFSLIMVIIIRVDGHREVFICLFFWLGWQVDSYHGKRIDLMMTSSNGNIFRVTGPLCGEFTGPGEFPTQRPVTRSFDVLFDLRLNKRLSKQPWGWWFETPSWSLWRQRNVTVSSVTKISSWWLAIIAWLRHAKETLDFIGPLWGGSTGYR